MIPAVAARQPATDRDKYSSANGSRLQSLPIPSLHLISQSRPSFRLASGRTRLSVHFSLTSQRSGASGEKALDGNRRGNQMRHDNGNRANDCKPRSLTCSLTSPHLDDWCRRVRIDCSHLSPLLAPRFAAAAARVRIPLPPVYLSSTSPVMLPAMRTGTCAPSGKLQSRAVVQERENKKHSLDNA